MTRLRLMADEVEGRPLRVDRTTYRLTHYEQNFLTEFGCCMELMNVWKFTPSRNISAMYLLLRGCSRKRCHEKHTEIGCSSFQVGPATQQS